MVPTKLNKLSILISYPYFRPEFAEFVRRVPRSLFDLIVDSGAFTAWNTGKEVLLDDYCRFLDSIADIRPFHAIQLDSIGNPEKTYENYLTMLNRGYSVLPVFTRGDSLENLNRLYETTDYVLFGGIAFGQKNSNYLKWILRNNAGRKAHWLGFVHAKFLIKYKPQSVDSSSWCSAGRFGALSLYKGGCSMKQFYKRDFVQKPDRKVFELLERNHVPGWAIDNLRFRESWHGWDSPSKTTRRGTAQFITTIGHVFRSLEAAQILGTKIYLVAGNVRQAEFLIRAFQRINGNDSE